MSNRSKALVEAPPPKGAVVLLLVSAALSAILHHVPTLHWLAWPFMLVSTLAHELGHGIAAVLVGGEFERFVMHADGSGLARTATSGGRLARAFVAAGGLVGPAFAAALLFVFGRTTRRARIGLGVIAALLALALLLVVRNLFGFAFVLTLVLLLGAVVRYGSDWVARFTLVFLAVQLALSVFSRSDYLFTPVARTGSGTFPSDVANMAEALWLPYWFWGALCGAVSLAVLALGVRAYLAPLRQPRALGAGSEPRLE